MSNPVDSPASRNTFMLDGKVPSPGLAILKSGGNQHEEIQDMGQPLTRGKDTLVRSTNNIVVTYEIRLWLPAHFAAWDAFEAMLFEGKQRTPAPRSYLFADPRVPRLTKAIVEDIGPEMVVARGGPWYHLVEFHQWTRTKKYGGAVKSPNPVEAETKALTADNGALNNQLEAMKRAARAGK